MNQYLRIKSPLQPFHLVKPSPWPILIAFTIFSIVSLSVSFLHFKLRNCLFFQCLFLGVFILFIFGIISWFFDIISEALMDGRHTLIVQRGLRLGVIIFIVSEIIFFFNFFLVLFYSSVSPQSGSEVMCLSSLESQPISTWVKFLVNMVMLLLFIFGISSYICDIISEPCTAGRHILIFQRSICLGVVFLNCYAPELIDITIMDGWDQERVRIRDDMPVMVDITDGDPAITGIAAPEIIGIPAGEWDLIDQPPMMGAVPGTGLPGQIPDPTVICPSSAPKVALTTRQIVEILVLIIFGIILVVYIVKVIIEVIVRAVFGKKDNGKDNSNSV